MHDLDLAKVAKAYGFSVPPAVNIPIGTSTKGAKRKSRDDDGDDGPEDEEEEGLKRHERPKMARNDKRRDQGSGRQSDKDFYREQKRPQANGESASTQWSR